MAKQVNVEIFLCSGMFIYLRTDNVRRLSQLCKLFGVLTCLYFLKAGNKILKVKLKHRTALQTQNNMSRAHTYQLCFMHIYAEYHTHVTSKKHTTESFTQLHIHMFSTDSGSTQHSVYLCD